MPRHKPTESTRIAGAVPAGEPAFYPQEDFPRGILDTITDPYADVTNQYRLSDFDATSDPSYYGHVDATGNWYILKLTESAGTVRYAKGTSGYTTAWTNRATQSYDYFSTTF